MKYLGRIGVTSAEISANLTHLKWAEDDTQKKKEGRIGIANETTSAILAPLQKNRPGINRVFLQYFHSFFTCTIHEIQIINKESCDLNEGAPFHP